MNLLYQLHELKNAAMLPGRVWSESADFFLKVLPDNLAQHIPIVSASTEMATRYARQYSKPEFGITTCIRQDQELGIEEEVVMSKAFCDLKRFWRTKNGHRVMLPDPKVLIVAPLSGHFATLLRGTVQAMIPDHDVYITDWMDARQIPSSKGDFSFTTYIDYLLDFIRYLGPNTHVIAVCQPSVPVLCAVSLLAEYDEACQPDTMTLMGGPIDTRINPGPVNHFANEHSLSWFQRNFISTVPAYYPGGGRLVCPGFVMLGAFMHLNLPRHQEARLKLFQHLIRGDHDSAESHRIFYDEYRAVMDLPVDYFLDSIRISFMEHLLPKKQLSWRGYLIRPETIQHTALLTVEGELDDISCPGQTYAAHDLCTTLSPHKKQSYVQEGTGHYGIFNGSRWRQFIQPKIAQFIRQHDQSEDTNHAAQS